jgi:FlaA1/EpsC-like NDP-sugar epimerase
MRAVLAACAESGSVKTNVTGTQWMLHAALATGVERFVTISTDKAADPINVLGFTKRIAERLTTAAGLEAGAPYVSVRFGNVLHSRGSVLETFHAQIASGGPVTVTAADVTRYFMTVDEAVQLTIQAGALGRPGEALVLDMGAPVRILDVAQRLIEAAGQPIAIEFIGLRRGEKLHEVLLAHDETGELRDHALIKHVAVPALAPDALSALATLTDAASLRRELQRLARLDTRSSAESANLRASSA